MAQPVPLPLDGAHWAFSLAVYARDSVPQSCLLLQDRCGIDVNLLLMSAYAAAVGSAPDADRIASTDAQVRPWREEIVKGLRILRRRLKDGPPPAPGPASNTLRDHVKAAELMAEQIQQATLAALLTRNAGQGRAADDGAIMEVLRQVLRYTAGETALADDEAAKALQVIGLAVLAWRQEHGVPVGTGGEIGR